MESCSFTPEKKNYQLKSFNNEKLLNSFSEIQHLTINYSAFLSHKQQSKKRALGNNEKKTLIKHNFLSSLVTKFIRIGIADKNDNPPYFDKALYEAEVDENEDIQHTVLTVTAKDHDECKSKSFHYLIQI